MDYQRGNRRPSSTALAKVRFLSVVCAKLRAEVVTVSRPPNFNRTEWLVAERAAARAAVHEIPAARDHQIAPPSEKTTRGLWHPTVTYFNDRWQRKISPALLPNSNYADSCKNPTPTLPEYRSIAACLERVPVETNGSTRRAASPGQFGRHWRPKEWLWLI